jgi:hypothetical protein
LLYIEDADEETVEGSVNKLEQLGGDGKPIVIHCLPFLLTLLFLLTDVQMMSPPTSPSWNLQGASQMTEGFMHGHALGNMFNIADAPDYEMELDLTLAIPGKVYIYDSSSDLTDLGPNTVKPQWILKTDVSRTIAPVLTKLACKYSPIRSMFHQIWC